jgi:polysaccharide export outer membrane protein
MERLLSFLRTTVARPRWPILPAVALVLVPTLVNADYKLQPGDTLEVSISGAPDVRQRAPIGVDGEIALPLVGQVKVAGLSLSEAREKITKDLSNNVYRQTGLDGREISKLILPTDVVVTAVEYRPIYVSGDVSKPGELPFRPGMTVRQAIAMAGGPDVMQSRLANPFLQAADFRAEYEGLWAELATQQVRIWRLRTELGERLTEPASNVGPIPAEFGERLMQAETAHLKARLADREKDKGLLREAINKADLQLGILAEKKKRDEEGAEADAADFQKVKELLQKGMTLAVRLSDARRAALLSSNQLLQTIVETSNLERQRGEYLRQLEKIDSQNRIDDWKDLQDANLRLAQITSRLRGTSEKLIYTGLLKGQFGKGTAKPPDIIVHRKGENGQEGLTANEDFELLPGDIVEVALKSENLFELAQPSTGDGAAAGTVTR